VSGKVKTPNGAAITPVSGSYYGTVNGYLQTNLGEPWATAIAQVPSGPAPISDATGTYSMKLIEGSYTVRAEQVPNLPTAANVGVAVSAAATQDLGVDAGGVITGNLKDAAQANVASVGVVIYDSTHTAIGQSSTDASGNFSVTVPYGTHDVFVGGALSASPTVNASSAAANLTLTQFQITGRLTDVQSNGVAARVRWGGNLGGVATSTANLGSYTIKVVQGLNWFQFTPTGTTTIGMVYEPLVQVDANTFKSLP
jgi:hypothetical protein